MNCIEIQNALPVLLYGELETEAAKRLEEHLAGCPDCRRELAALKLTQKRLDAVPAPAVQLDVGRIFQEEAQRRLVQLRRWRRLALAAAAVAAASILVALLLNLEVRVEGHQLVLRWGSPPALPERIVDQPSEVNPEATAALQAQLVVLTQLAQGLTETAAGRDAKQRKELTQIRDNVRDLQRQLGYRLNSIERDQSALYAAVFGPSKKGATE
jgi:anti-sigma factor RsiW